MIHSLMIQMQTQIMTLLIGGENSIIDLHEIDDYDSDDDSEYEQQYYNEYQNRQYWDRVKEAQEQSEKEDLDSESNVNIYVGSFSTFNPITQYNGSKDIDLHQWL